MADQAIDGSEDIDIDDDDDEEKSVRPGGKKRILLIAAALLVLCLAGAGAYFGGLVGGEEEAEHAEEAVEPEPRVFYDLPDMLVNLNSTGRKQSFLKLSVSLELESQDEIELIRTVLPRIVDNFQVYLRELRVEDLQGSEGIYRLREELLSRVNRSGPPVHVKNVLFKEILVQ